MWFSWIAPTTSDFDVSTCGGATFDTALAAYSGTCGSLVSLACNDDSCGLQSTVRFAATAGSQYYIRVGSFSAGPGGAGTFTIDEVMTGGGTIGADVIVGSIPDARTWGASNGIAGYSLATTSCNVGDQELLWISNTNQHPVIGQNIYRAQDGKFEQIGQGWLKHGFFALQQNLCSPCTPSSSGGSRLGVGCSDPYGAGLNGQQSGLGPRSQVNAFTGDFQYPFMAQGQTGDAAYKRVQVSNDDVDPALNPNATYFGEAQYVSPDDAAAGNGFNNVSWVGLNRGTVTNGAWRLTVGGATNRMEAAIHAWATVETGVTIEEVIVPNEGQYVIASKVTDLNNGNWRYAYAVFNQNSDFCGQSFSVPVGTTPIGNIGMSFPNSHSGEPFSNAAWTSNVANGTLTWETEDFATNPNANALRWGTTYSFWFEAVAPPQSGMVSLGLFKPGNPGAQLTTLEVPQSGGSGVFVSNYCTANLNSTIETTKIAANNVDLMARTMDIDVSDMPLNQFGFIVTSLDQGFVPNPGTSAGNLCLGGAIGRGVGGVWNSGGSGSITINVDLDSIITASGAFVPVMAGETRHFQAWHRDITGLGSQTSNFSDGLRVSFP